VICRELTKVHEEVWRGSLEEAARTFAEREVLGEVVVVLAGAPPAEAAGDDAVAASVRQRLASGDSPRAAADAVSRQLGVARRRAYAEALSQRDGTA
jgi:16S rRNA (cytidine1402-2'-O)-methyltransferase